MWYSATLNAYDVMGTVFVTASVRAQEDTQGQPIATVLQVSTAFDGEGEGSPRLWLLAALVGLAETL